MASLLCSLLISRYERDPPKVTTLYGIAVPGGPKQTVRYDDDTGDELEVSLGGTSCESSFHFLLSLHSEIRKLNVFVSTVVSGKKMFDILPAPLKSLAVRTKVQYSPHPYVFMSSAKALSTGLGMVSEGLETKREDLPPWEESKIKILPMVRF